MNPYEQEENSNTKLEFVGILPNDNVNEFIKNLTKEKYLKYSKSSLVCTLHKITYALNENLK